MRIRVLAATAATSGGWKVRPSWGMNPSSPSPSSSVSWLGSRAAAAWASSVVDPTRSVRRFELPGTLEEYGVSLITQEAYEDRSTL